MQNMQNLNLTPTWVQTPTPTPMQILMPNQILRPYLLRNRDLPRRLILNQHRRLIRHQYLILIRRRCKPRTQNPASGSGSASALGPTINPSD